MCKVKENQRTYIQYTGDPLIDVFFFLGNVMLLLDNFVIGILRVITEFKNLNIIQKFIVLTFISLFLILFYNAYLLFIHFYGLFFIINSNVITNQTQTIKQPLIHQFFGIIYFINY